MSEACAALYSPDHVARHIAAHWHYRGANVEAMRSFLSADSYELKRVSVKSIPGYDYDVHSPELASLYARLTTGAPAIVLGTAEEQARGEVLVDGYHRLRAAYERGDYSVLAFVPVP